MGQHDLLPPRHRAGRNHMSYRRLASPLHAARAGAGCAYCLALALAALLVSNPLALAAVVLAITLAGVGAGVGSALRRAAVLGVPLAVAIALVNALVTRDGLTVIVRLGDLPVLGHVDITLEATAYGAILGCRAFALLLCGALYTAAVDPDDVLRLFRRVSFRSALTATLATRMVPVLVRDSTRLADAQRCRPGRPPSRVALMRAATSGVLDRALDVAAALEVRGYGVARRPPRSPRPLSRHDAAFMLSAVALVMVAAGARIGGLVPFQAYPSLRAPLNGGVVTVSVAVLACALLPFADRRGIESAGGGGSGAAGGRGFRAAGGGG
jgi:energy-coupling factor transport system permease protein